MALELTTTSRLTMRELRIELAILNHRVGSRSQVKDVDFDCLDVITRHDQILESYSDDQIDLITGFLRRCTQAGQSAADQLAQDPE